MKALKIIGISLLALVAIFLLLGLFAPKKYHVERQLAMDASKATIFPYLADLKKHKAWEPWEELDPNMEQTYEGPDGQVGQTVIWKGNKDVGEGRQEITGLKPNERVDVDIYFLPYEHPNPTYFNLADKDGQTVVAWGMQAHFPFPMNIFMVFFSFEKNVGADFDKGLANLKAVVESAPETPSDGLKVNTINFPTTTFITHREVIPMDDITPYYTQHLPAIMGHVMSKGYEPDGMPRGLYYDWNEEAGTVNLGAAIAVKSENPDSGSYQLITLNAQKALQVDFYGNYPDVGAAHEAIDKYVTANNLTVLDPAIEEYVTDPGMEPDTSKWLTKVTYFYEQ